MWKNDYHDLMFSRDIENLHLEEAFKLKYFNIPQSLYKYREINKYSIDNLKNDTAWFSKATDFNDPYDSGLTINKDFVHFNKIKEDILREFCTHFRVDYDEVSEICSSLNLDDSVTLLLRTVNASNGQAKFIRDTVRKVLIGTSDIYDKYVADINLEYQRRIFVSCFSEIPDSMLMWSHYAKDHTGVCVEYDFSRIDLKNELVWGLHPVNYTKKLLDINEYSNEIGEKMSTLVLAAISKSIDWEYEKEWRIVLLEASNKESYAKEITTPTSIILGSRISEENKEIVVEIAKSKLIPLKQVQLDRTKYSLNIIDLNF